MTVAEFEAYGQDLLESTQALLRRIPPERLDWRPVESAMSFGELAEHLVTAFSEVVEMAVTQQWPSHEQLAELAAGGQPSTTPAEAIARIDDQKDRLGELLAGISDETWLHDQRRLPWGVQGSLGFCCASAIDHAAGHRYQLFLYLKLIGQTLGTMELYNIGEMPASG